MTRVECTRCNQPFDADREAPAGKHADTRRCPGCGNSHTDAEVEEYTVSAATDGGGTAASAVEITLTIEIAGQIDEADMEVSVHD